jgi:hypothetical protein
MPAYHQVGHNSENLLLEPELSTFHGAVLSPVNYDEADTTLQVVAATAARPGFDAILDPQLYYPSTNPFDE